MLLLERHGLEPLAQVDLPAPFVFEDIAPRPIAWQGGRGLLTVRSGPQMAVVAARRGHSGQLVLAAVGEPIGSSLRFLDLEIESAPSGRVKCNSTRRPLRCILCGAMASPASPCSSRTAAWPGRP